MAANNGDDAGVVGGMEERGVVTGEGDVTGDNEDGGGVAEEEGMEQGDGLGVQMEKVELEDAGGVVSSERGAPEEEEMMEQDTGGVATKETVDNEGVIMARIESKMDITASTES